MLCVIRCDWFGSLRSIRLPVAAVLAAALFAGGCGSSDEKSVASPTEKSAIGGGDGLLVTCGGSGGGPEWHAGQQSGFPTGTIY